MRFRPINAGRATFVCTFLRLDSGRQWCRGIPSMIESSCFSERLIASHWRKMGVAVEKFVFHQKHADAGAQAYRRF